MTTVIRVSFVGAVLSGFIWATLVSGWADAIIGLQIVFGTILLIMSTGSLQLEGNKRRELPVVELLQLGTITGLYYWFFATNGFRLDHFMEFAGFALFIVNGGGFLFGLLFSWLIARHLGIHDPRIKAKVRAGLQRIKRVQWLPVLIFMALASIFCLVLSMLELWEIITGLDSSGITIILISLSLLFLLVLRLTFRASIWGDPQNYGFQESRVLRWYFGQNYDDES